MAMYSRVESITPDVAQEYLKRNKSNRTLKPAAIRNYARDMKNGDWQLTPQGISFFENGSLADGQNRLHAVVRAGVPVEFYVTYNVPDSNTIQDRGVMRTSSDTLHMEGIRSAAASTHGISIINFLFGTCCGVNVSDSVRIEFIREHEPYLVGAVRAASSKKAKGTPFARKAPVMAAVFCALYSGVSEEVVTNFCEVLNTGFMESPEQSSGVVIRNYLIKEYTHGSSNDRRNVFTMTLFAIRDFMNHVPRKMSYRTDYKPPFWEYAKSTTLDKYLAAYKEKDNHA